MASHLAPLYRPRRVRGSPLYRFAEEHFEAFKQVYDDRFASRYGYWRVEIERTRPVFVPPKTHRAGSVIRGSSAPTAPPWPPHRSATFVLGFSLASSTARGLRIEFVLVFPGWDLLSFGKSSTATWGES